MRGHFWTPEEDDQLRELHARSLTTREIGMELHCSRNAVIGRLHRLGIMKPRLVAVPKREKQPPKPKAVSEGAGFILKPKPVPEPSAGDGVGILEVTGCRWPISDDKANRHEHRFCNHLVEGDGSYCAHHKQMNVASYSQTLIKKTITVALYKLRKVAA